MADASDVTVPTGAEIGITLAAGLNVAQIHAQRPTNRPHASWSLVGLPRGITRDHDGMVRRHRKLDLQDWRSA
jgi:hypothetical protein